MDRRVYRQKRPLAHQKFIAGYVCEEKNNERKDIGLAGILTTHVHIETPLRFHWVNTVQGHGHHNCCHRPHISRSWSATLCIYPSHCGTGGLRVGMRSLLKHLVCCERVGLHLLSD